METYVTAPLDSRNLYLLAIGTIHVPFSQNCLKEARPLLVTHMDALPPGLFFSALFRLGCYFEFFQNHLRPFFPFRTSSIFFPSHFRYMLLFLGSETTSFFYGSRPAPEKLFFFDGDPSPPNFFFFSLKDLFPDLAFELPPVFLVFGASSP